MIRAAVLSLVAAVGPAAAQQATDASGAQLRGVDKITGEIYNFSVGAGQTVEMDRISVKLSACRYPIGNPAGDAFAFVDVHDIARGDELFSGWMIASSPALSAMEHPRYDIWVIRCTTS